MMLKKNPLNRVKMLAVTCLFATTGVAFAQEAPPERINHRNMSSHVGFLVNGVANSGLGRTKASKLVRTDASKFSASNDGYQVDANTAAWQNNYNPLTDGGADANWVDDLYGPHHPLNDKFFRDGEYNSRKFLAPSTIKRNVSQMTQEELDSLPSIRKYDLTVGDFSMSATKYEMRVRGLERKPEVQGWEGFCYPMRAIGAMCPEPTKVISKKIPGTRKSVNWQPYDVKTVMAVNWDLSEKYARMGDINRGDRDSDPANAGAFHVMLQSYKIMKEKHSELPFAAIFDVEPDAELWNEALQNWSSDYTSVKTLTAAQKRNWNTPSSATKFVDVVTSVDLTEEAGVVNEASRQNTVDGYGLNTMEYEYRLYLSSRNKIVGGDWLEDSGRSFPDLVGFSNGAGQGSPAVDHDEVVELIQDSTVEHDKIIPGTR